MAYSYEHDPLNPDSKPLYNDSIFKVWKWFDNRWSCNDWMIWHKANVLKYGLQRANSKFMAEWDNLAFISKTQDCRSFNTDFRNYMRKVGLLNSLYGGTGVIAQPIGAANDIVSNVSGGFSNASKILKIALPILMIGVVIVATLYLTKYAKKSSK